MSRLHRLLAFAPALLWAYLGLLALGLGISLIDGAFWAYYPYELRRGDVLLLAFVGVFALIDRFIERDALRLALATLVFFALLMVFRTFPIGDHDHWIRQAAHPILWYSDLLSNLLYRSWAVAGLDLYFVAPLAGLLTFPLFVYTAETLCGRRIPLLLLLSAGFLQLFYYGQVENPYLGLPFLMGFFLCAAAHLQAERPRHDRLIAGAACLALACLVHGVYTFLLPLGLLLLVLGPDGQRVKSGLLFAGTGLAVVAGTIVLLRHLIGFTLVAGNMHGGTDRMRFVPLSRAGLDEEQLQWTRFTFFSVDHLEEVANIAFFACPALFYAGAVGLWHRHRKIEASPPDALHQFLAFAGLAYLGFISLWGFDLGVPRDLDLMLTLGATLNLFAFAAIVRRDPQAHPKLGVQLLILLPPLLLFRRLLATML